jgi:thioredoxin 1
MGESTLTISDADFETLVAGSAEPLVVDFWAPWCGPCRLVGPIVEELAVEYGGAVKVGKVNVDDNQVVAARFGISSIPTILIFKGGELKDRITGALPKPALKARIDAVI